MSSGRDKGRHHIEQQLGPLGVQALRSELNLRQKRRVIKIEYSEPEYGCKEKTFFQILFASRMWESELLFVCKRDKCVLVL